MDMNKRRERKKKKKESLFQATNFWCDLLVIDNLRHLSPFHDLLLVMDTQELCIMFKEAIVLNTCNEPVFSGALRIL